MLSSNHLAIRQVRVNAPKNWANSGNAMTFILPTKGRGRFVCGSIKQPMAPGDVLVLSEGSNGEFAAEGSSESVFWNFFARQEHLYPLFDSNEISLLQSVIASFGRIRHYPADSEVGRRCHKLLRELEPKVDLNHRIHVVRIICAIFASEFQNARSRRHDFSRPEESVMHIFKALSAQQILNLTNEELAAKFNCSSRHLNRLFTRHLGCSIGTLRMKLRLIKAASLLRNPDAKIIRVAEECGFNHLGLFNKCFRRRFGVNPTEWRKQTNAEAEKCGEIAANSALCKLRKSGLCPWAGKHGDTLPFEKILPSGLPDASFL